METLKTKNDLLAKLTNYTEKSDDFCILFKEKIKANLLKSPELLYALNNPMYATELFNDDGSINYEGEWDLYFNTNIKPFAFIPEVQESIHNFLCYNVGFDEIPRYNKTDACYTVRFVVLCDQYDAFDTLTGISRHDLIGSIIRERFNWSNIFGTQCRLIENKESITDNNYMSRTLLFELILPNSIVKTRNGVTSVINNVEIVK